MKLVILNESAAHLISKRNARLAMFFSGLFMGFVGLFVTFFSSRPIYSVVVLRGIFGMICLMVILLMRKHIKYLPLLLKCYPFATIIQGLFGALTVYFYFESIQRLNYALGAFLLYIGPVFTLLNNRAFLKIKIYKMSYFAFPIALIGLLLIFDVGENFILDQGLIFGLASAICLSISTSAKSYVFEKINGNSTSTSELNIIHAQSIFPIFVCLSLLIFFISPSDILTNPLSLSEIGIGLLLGLIPTALAFTLFNVGLHFDEGGDVLILSYSEPIVAAAISILVQGIVDPLFYLGGALIIFSNVIILRKKPLPARI